jgi:23S rRNA pseudouridine955/2504/2580 synthase
MPPAAAPIFPLGAGVRILAQHPSGLLALEKPIGLATHPNRPTGETHTLLDAPYDLDAECYLPADGSPPLFLLNRLDSPTSGIVLAATDATLATAIKTLFRQHTGAVAKTYYAVVAGGRLQPPAGLWRDRLGRARPGANTAANRPNRNAAAGIRAVAGGAGGLPAVSHYEWLTTVRHPVAGQISLLRLSPETGRTHQLRIQCAARARPILGDKTYGDFPLNRRIEKFANAAKAANAAQMNNAAQTQTEPEKSFSRLFLHAAAIEVHFHWRGRPETFRALSPLPPTFTSLFPGFSPKQFPGKTRIFQPV